MRSVNETAERRSAVFSRLAFGSDHLVGTVTSAGEDFGITVFAPFVPLNREIEVRIVSRKKNLIFAEPLQLDWNNTAPRCPYYAVCGGCSLQHISLAEQRELKLAMVRDTVLRKLKVDVSDQISFQHDSSDGYSYRNLITLHVNRDGELGFYRRGSNKIVPIQACAIAESEINNVLSHLVKVPAPLLQGLTAVEIRSGEPAEIRLFYTERDAAKHEALSATLSGVATLSFYSGKRQTHDFRQVNSAGNLQLTQLLSSLLSGQDLLELFSGNGNLTQAYAEKCAKVICVEQSERLHRLAQQRFIENGWNDRVTSVCTSAEKYVASRTLPNTVLLDPPRTGARDVSVQIAQSDDVRHVVYVSCYLATWIRDCEPLLQSGFSFKSIYLIDMFPQTNYVEIVSQLER